ncbi:uncharacterized protein LOC127261191 [Andrographis paniculata]|uniref:uncharacterized protein LOC127261191 n=1 Tax=Andrographis paniculata TaxID=175694 RepID=UPI0021E80A09|nr:uncharacterized protein LOC127261191 [Andrographis paniculata]
MDLAANPKVYGVVVLLILSFILGFLYRDNYSQAPLLLSAATVTAADAELHHKFPTKCAEAVPPAKVRETIIQNVFHGESPWTGFPPAHAKPLLLEKFAVGWGSNAAVFERLIRRVRPRTIIEVGTYLGASAIHMAGIAEKLGLEGVQILCIDDFRGWPAHADAGKVMEMVNGDTMLLYQFMQNVAAANATESVVYLPFSTTTAMNGLCSWGVYGDLVEIDADHEFHSAWVDINNGYRVVRKPGGVMFGHDYKWEGVRRAVHLFARLHGLGVRRDGEHWVLY